MSDHPDNSTPPEDKNEMPEGSTPPPAETQEAVPPTPAPAPAPAPTTGGGGFGSDFTEKQWGMFLHLSQLVNFVIPLGGVVAPILIWQLKKEQFPGLDAHGKMVANWLISSFIYGIALAILTCWIGGLGVTVVMLCSIVFAIIGGLKANEGELWEYPITIKFIK